MLPQPSSATEVNSPASPKRFTASVVGTGEARFFQMVYRGLKSPEGLLLDKPTALHHWIARGLIKEPPSFSVVHLDKTHLSGVFLDGEKLLYDSPDALARLEAIFEELAPHASGAPPKPTESAAARVTIQPHTTLDRIKVKRVGFGFKLVFDTTFTEDDEMSLEEGMKYLEDHNLLRPYALVKVSTHIKAREQHQDTYREVEDGSIDLNTANEKQVEEFFNRFLPVNVASGARRRKHDPRVAEWVTFEEPTPRFSVADDRGGHVILACRVGNTVKFDLALTPFNTQRLKADVASMAPTLCVALAFPRVSVEDGCPAGPTAAREFDLADARQSQDFASYLNECVRAYEAWARALVAGAEREVPPGPASAPTVETTPPAPAVAAPVSRPEPEGRRGEPTAGPDASPPRTLSGAASPPTLVVSPGSAPEAALAPILPDGAPLVAPPRLSSREAASRPLPPSSIPKSGPAPAAPITGPEPGAAWVDAFRRKLSDISWQEVNRAVFESLAGHFDLAASTDPSGFQVLALAEETDKTSPEFSGFVLGPSGCFIFSCWGEYVRFGAAVTIRCTGEPDLVELPGPALLGAAVHCSGEREDLVLLVSDTLSQKLGQAVGKRCRERLSSFVSLLGVDEFAPRTAEYDVLWPPVETDDDSAGTAP